VKLGGSVQWTFYGPRVHRVADASGMGLFDSGPKPIVTSFSRAFTAAGNYAYGDPGTPAVNGTVSVPLGVAPASGSTSTSFALTWATKTADPGYGYDVQVKRPGSSIWSTLRTGASSPGQTFVPDAGPGTYSFRARLRTTTSGKWTGWSAAKSISVS
jgi:hypothetical protein